MNRIKKLQAFSITLFFFSWVLALEAHALTTRDRILDKITVTTRESHLAVNVSFNFPVRYVRHYPLDNGTEVRIQLEAILANREEREALNRRESLFPPTNNPAGVVRVEYEGRDINQPTVTVIFDKTTQFDARQGDDFRSLAVIIPKEKAPVTKPAEKKPVVPVKKAPSGPGALTAELQEKLLLEADQTLADKNYPRAVQIFTKLLQSSDPAVLERAQYQLAVARENNGHLAHAKAEYRNYLREYPDGDYSEDAYERLKRILSGRAIGTKESLWESDFFGSFSQFYFRDESFSDDDEDDDDSINTSSMFSNFDATWRLRTDNYNIETVIIGGYELDLLDNEDGNEFEVSSLYVDFENASETFSTRIGRQTGSSGGVFGRFDGGRFGYQLTDKIRVNLVGGFPVNQSSDEVETERYFYGINFDLGRFADHWDFNWYFINQMASGIEDRRAIGGEIRYVGERGSFFTLLDYDILFSDLNLALFAGNWLMPNDKTRLNFFADFRKSPLLSTSNGIIGQTSPSLEALEASLGEEALRQLAEDRTLDSSFVSVGFSHPLNDHFQIAGDISWSKLDGSPASGGVAAIESTGDEWFYSTQLIGTDLLKKGDISTIGLRYADTKARDTYTLTLNSRYPINDVWRINPKLQVDYRVNKNDSGEQWRFRPGLRVEYQLPHNLRLEFEGGLSLADRELPGLAEDTKGYFFSVGLRWDF